jgi:hypothetical protein
MRRDLLAHPAPEWAGFFTVDEYGEFLAVLGAELDRRHLYAPHPHSGLVKVWDIGDRDMHRKANLKEPVAELWLGDLARSFHRAERRERAELVGHYLDHAIP